MSVSIVVIGCITMECCVRVCVQSSRSGLTVVEHSKTGRHCLKQQTVN